MGRRGHGLDLLETDATDFELIEEVGDCPRVRGPRVGIAKMSGEEVHEARACSVPGGGDDSGDRDGWPRVRTRDWRGVGESAISLNVSEEWL